MARTDGKRKGPPTKAAKKPAQKSPANKKSKSGAQKRRERKERLEAAVATVKDQAHALGLPVGVDEISAAAEASSAFAGEFAEAGSPDLENPDTDLAYVRRLQLIALRQMACTPFPSKAQVAHWARIKDMAATVGMTHPRAALETKLKAVEANLERVKRTVGAVKMEPGNAVVRPSTARGRRGTRGPRALPQHGAGAPKGEDE